MTAAAPDRAAYWAAEAVPLTGPWGGVNMAWAAVDRHVAAGRGDRPALRWTGRDGATATLSYADLSEASGRFAALLRGLGVGKGNVVASLLPRRPVLYAAALGALRAGCVHAPLFAAFGPEPLRLRLTLAGARAVVTTSALWARKAPASLPDPFDALLVDGEGWEDRLAALEPAPCVSTGPDDPALLHFTSGTTGAPKGALHGHGAIVAQHATARDALGLRAGDVFWCTADPGWVTGTVYGLLAPLAVGATLVADEGDFDPARWYALLERERVSVWYTTPTAIRMLMRAGLDLPRRHDLSALRHVASVGEPLNAEAVTWGEAAFGRPIHDTWWQTETGAIMLATPPGQPVVPGTLGFPVPGIEADVLAQAGEAGELVLRPPWPSMFQGYLHDEAHSRACFTDDGWYRSGDLARRDPDGRFRFVGRADDMIKTSGHLVGPFEVESVLLEHPAVAEAAVIGRPDPVAGEVVEAFVALKAGVVGDDALARDLVAHARRRLGPALAPRAIAFADSLPHTRSGKILRRLLKARELGLPEGDTSTLQDGGR
ncbi:AMP-binding protein [Azospirillum rugosum]|uniref:acetate--CoA ligase n=1 Tax=Azospirillum rugosum TaxID=416170 RepID=A0ABS4SWJ8_9PROT|nr:AMP-binding protein [Azospirillum rugosum]MBP2296923.1 acetyl-CoA synthetase [Azospirillum rugosum]MDQ0530682.1 acetyl-CoA synthetase [Azospirillum rugosum]